MIEKPISGENEKWKRYKRGKMLGIGGFGIIYEAFDLENNTKVVIKTLKRKNKESEFNKEINIMKQINHPSVVSLIDTFQDQENIFNAVLYYAEKGSILNDILHYGIYSEEKVKKYMKSIIEGLASIHQKEIIHNDIKASNILIDINDKAIIADFGASIDTKINKNFKPSIGSPHWMAPEIASGLPATLKSDIWSIGILTIEMLTGKPPLHHLPGPTVLMILKEAKRIPISLKVSDACLSFIKMCLQSNPEFRPNADDLLYHPFLNDNNENDFSNVYINLANQIFKEECNSDTELNLEDVLGSNIDKLFKPINNFKEINCRFILYEAIALTSKGKNDQIILQIINYLIKFNQIDKITSEEISKIILFCLRKVENINIILSNHELIDYLSKESFEGNSLIFMAQDQLKLIDKEKFGFNEMLSFISQYQYDTVYQKLTKFYQYVELPKSLRCLLNDKMSKISSELFSKSLQAINSSQPNESQIREFGKMLDTKISNYLTEENAFLIFDTLEKSGIDVFGYEEQERIAQFILSCCINQDIFKENDESKFKENIEKGIYLFGKMTKINHSIIINQKKKIWEVLYENLILRGLSILSDKCKIEYEKNLNMCRIFKMLRSSFLHKNYENIKYFIRLFKNSTTLLSKFSNDELFIEFAYTLYKVPPNYQNDYLEIVNLLLQIPDKHKDFYVCLRGQLTKMSVFSQNKNAEILLNILDCQ